MTLPPGNSLNHMKPYPGHCFGITQYLAMSVWLLCGFLLAQPKDVRAQNIPSEASEQPGLPPAALQSLLAKSRSRGPVFVAIPTAYRYGIGGDNAAYCSPSIRATNSSNEVVEELIIGIDYFTATGKPAGTTITRYDNVKVRHQDTHFFYQLAVSDCVGLEGQVSIVRCIYSTGEDCSPQVQAIGFGTIPLRLKTR